MSPRRFKPPKGPAQLPIIGASGLPLFPMGKPEYSPAFRGGRALKKPPGVLNKTEQERADELELARKEGRLLAWYFTPFSMKLADDNARYTPDFMVVYPDGLIEFEEIKGHWEDAALVRIKVAADRYPFTFCALQKKPKKHGGGWERRVFRGWTDTDMVSGWSSSVRQPDLPLGEPVGGVE